MHSTKCRDVCLNCHASYYDSKDPDIKKVDKIYEIKIGKSVINLCSDCMKELAEKIEEQI